METIVMSYMGGCRNYCPFLGTLNIRCRIVIGIQIKRDHNFDSQGYQGEAFDRVFDDLPFWTLGFRV